MIRLRCLREFFGHLFGHLPAVLFLSSVCLLAHHTAPYAWIEWVSVKFVATLAHPNENTLGPGEIIAITATPTFFSSEFDSRLPLARGKVAEVVSTLAEGCPSLIAVDIDIAPTGDTEPERKAGTALVRTIGRALDDGIDVVAITYPSLGRKRDHHKLDVVCAALAPATRSAESSERRCRKHSPPGRFVLANPMLVPEGPFHLMYRTSREFQGKHDSRLGSVIAELRRTSNTTHQVPGMCAGVQVDADALEAVDAGEVMWHDSEETMRIRFFGSVPEGAVSTLPPIDSIVHLKQYTSEISDRAVVFSVESFAGLDKHLTPVGEMTGALVHAHIANSIDQPMVGSSLVGFAWDVGIGLIFVTAILFLNAVQKCLVDATRPNLAMLAMLLAPLIVFGGLLALASWISAALFARGFWLDPLPVMVGLALHLYVEALQPEHAGAHQAHGLCPWCASSWQAWKTSLGLTGAHATVDMHVLSAVRLLMVGVVLVALWTLINSH